MAKKIYSNQNLPDFAVPPGDTLAETLEAMHLTQADLAKRTNRPRKTINEIIKGVAQITPETAIQFEQVLGAPASFWLNLERNYRETVAREQETKQLAKQTRIAKKYPLSELMKLKFIPSFTEPKDTARALLSFFGVVDLDIVPTLYEGIALSFKKSPVHSPDNYALYAWLRQGELQANEVSCAPYDKGRFLQSLNKIKRLITESHEVFLPGIVELCAQAGVAVAFVPEVKGCRSYGVSRWLSPDKGLIMLSLRQKSDDHLWFTFFHEAAHILLHRKKSIYIDMIDGSSGIAEEQQANKFAAEFLIDSKSYEVLRGAFKVTEHVIRHFAAEQNLTPGIVLGRLQHDGIIPYNSFLNKLKIYYTWKN